VRAKWKEDGIEEELKGRHKNEQEKEEGKKRAGDEDEDSDVTSESRGE
jgi:hypothetical protein